MSAEDFEVFKEIRAERQAMCRDRLQNADTSGWDRFSAHHFHRQVDGHRMEWWPSTNKWLYKGKYYRGALPQILKDKIK